MGLKEPGLRGSLRNVSVGIDAIPDPWPESYLQDDWGDNKLQDRDGSDTTTYNGVEGVYRPEWTLDEGSPEVADERLTLDGDGEAVVTEINLNLDESITWEFSNVSLNTDGALALQLFSEDDTFFDLDTTAPRMDDGYMVEFSMSNDRIRLTKNSGGGTDAMIESGVSPSAEEEFDIIVTRSSDGEFELIVDGDSKGTDTDTDFIDPSHTGFGTSTDGTDLGGLGSFSVS